MIGNQSHNLSSLGVSECLKRELKLLNLEHNFELICLNAGHFIGVLEDQRRTFIAVLQENLAIIPCVNPKII